MLVLVWINYMEKSEREVWASEMRMLFSPPGMLNDQGAIDQAYFRPKHVSIISEEMRDGQQVERKLHAANWQAPAPTPAPAQACPRQGQQSSPQQGQQGYPQQENRAALREAEGHLLKILE